MKRVPSEAKITMDLFMRPRDTIRKDEVSLRRMKWLLGQRGYRFWPEDRLGGIIEVSNRRPDFYVQAANSICFLAEVKSFEKEVSDSPLHYPSNGATVGTVDPAIYERIYDRIRGAVQEASAQLGAYRDRGIPLLVVLDSWRGGMPTGSHELISVFGTREGRGSFDPLSGKPGPARWHHGGGQRLNNRQGRYISGVAWNKPRQRRDDLPPK